MKIQVTKTVNEEIEVELPFFSSRHSGQVNKVTDDAVIKVVRDSIIIYEKKHSHVYYNSELNEAYNEKRITEDKFNEKFAEAIENIETLAGVSDFSHLNKAV